MSVHHLFGGLSALAGALRVVPGAKPPRALQSTRRDWAAKLAAGQRAAALPGLMASVFNLCSQAHRLCSQLAIQAAAPLWPVAPQHVAQRLRTETAQEHIRRIGIDWPRLLSVGASGAAVALAHGALRRCPLLATGGHADAWPATLTWLQDDLLQMPAATWETQWQAGGAAWLNEWACQHHGWLAGLVRGATAADDAVHVNPTDALPAPVSVADAHTLAALLRTQPDFTLAPQWQGACAHTGSWTRLGAPRPAGLLTPWGLLGSRLSELARLCLYDAANPAGPDTLSFGAMQTGEGQGLAWVEMARGLLAHRVDIREVQDGAMVSACNVLAPTEWNFHAHGVVAQYIAELDVSLPAEVQERKVRMLMAAFDPCVPFEVLPQQPSTETSHA